MKWTFPKSNSKDLQTEIPELEKEFVNRSQFGCVTCEQCYARCPKDVDLPKIMDYLRSESIRRGLVNPKAKDILAFHKSFLDSVRLTGKLYEIGLIGGYKMRTMHLMQDVNVAPTMYFNGKLNLFPSQVKNKKAIQRIFEKAQSEEENK
jgi:heterodisulfide reductase subunit C